MSKNKTCRIDVPLKNFLSVLEPENGKQIVDLCTELRDIPELHIAIEIHRFF